MSLRYVIIKVLCVIHKEYWKGPRRRSTTGLIDKNTVKRKPTAFSQSVYRSSVLNFDVRKSQKYGCERCHFMSGSLCLWRHEQSQHVWQKCPPSCANIFESLLVQSKPAWTHPEKFSQIAPWRVQSNCTLRISVKLHPEESSQIAPWAQPNCTLRSPAKMHLEELSQIAPWLVQSNSKQKTTKTKQTKNTNLLHRYLQKNHAKPAHGNIYTFKKKFQADLRLYMGRALATEGSNTDYHHSCPHVILWQMSLANQHSRTNTPPCCFGGQQWRTLGQYRSNRES